MPGRIYNEIYDIAADQGGYITTEDAHEAGFDVRRLSDLERRGQAERVAVGLYRLRVIPRQRYDPYVQAALWHHKTGVISHETALDLWDVCDINPGKIHVTIPPKPRLTRKVPAGYVVHVAILPDRSKTVVEGVPIVTLDRAIRECAAIHTRPDLLRDAVNNGRKTGKLRVGDALELIEELQLGVSQ